MTWAYKNRGPKYHWIVDLYSRMGLPVLDGIQEMCEADNNDRMKRLERKRSELGKKKRVQSKINRTEEQALRKKFVRNCQIRHTYGDEDDDDMDINEQDAVRLTEQAIASGTTQAAPICEQPAAAPREAEVMIGGKSCKWCGSTSHLRKSHKDCPFNDKKKNSSKSDF